MKSQPLPILTMLLFVGCTLSALPSRAAQPLACLIEPQRSAEIGSPVIGVVEELRVERGDRVSKGQVLALLRADVERAAVGVAQSRLQAEAEEQAALAASAHARQKFMRVQGLFEQDFVSAHALDQARAEADVAERRLAQTREQRQIWARERDLAATQLALRSIRSPIDGVVAERYVSVGERVEQRPLLRIAQIDPLKVLVVAPVALYGKVRPGLSVTIAPQLPDALPVVARVTLVDPLVDAASNTFRVQLELPNPERSLPAGLRCKADFGFAAPAEPKAAVAAPAKASL